MKQTPRDRKMSSDSHQLGPGLQSQAHSDKNISAAAYDMEEKKVDKNQMNPLQQSKRLAKASDASTNYDSQSNTVSTSTTSGRKARRHLA